MSFRFPSHNNSANQRTERRANWKAEMKNRPAAAAGLTLEQEIERIEKLAVALAAAGCVTKTTSGYRVQLSPMNWREVIENDGLYCVCADDGKFKTCAHVRAVKKFRFALEVAERRRTDAGSIAHEQAVALGKCFWCHDENIIDEHGSEVSCAFCGRMPIAPPTETEEEFEMPSRGFVNVTERKVIAAVERVAGQEFSCQVRKTGTGCYEVFSFTSTNTYRVELNRGIFGVTAYCSCPDFTARRLPRDEMCKHQAAVYHFERRASVVSLNEFNAPSFAAAA